ncbi:MAG: hypothetical protein U0990_00375, partial [Candidatus Nanopelagicales bacterium]|nr:hypothetical protein [Candidatus Nanopelagicales bacterium]
SPVRPLATNPYPHTLTRGSRMTGDRHVRFCESRGVQLPPATHLCIIWASAGANDGGPADSGLVVSEQTPPPWWWVSYNLADFVWNRHGVQAVRLRDIQEGTT